MATSALAGYKAILAFSTSSTGGALTAVAELRDYTMSVEHAEIDATSHDSSGDREIIAGTGSWSGTAELLTVMGNATHQSAYDMLVARTKFAAEFRPTGSSSDGYFSGALFLTGLDMSAPNDDAFATSISFVGTGVLTRSSCST